MTWIQRTFFLMLTSLGALATQRAQADGGSYSVGGEYLRDRYLEDSLGVDVHSNLGSVTGSYTYEGDGAFGSVEGRYSQGTSDYKSPSGVLNGNRQLEGEMRVIAGVSLPLIRGTLKPYAGLGERLFFDRGKGTVTNTGALAYDRHISQMYIPIGAFLQFQAGNWTFTPRGEFDLLLHGRVNTHLGVLGGTDISNKQHSGQGWRGEFMVGQQYKSFGWEAGPFIRYWSVRESDAALIALLPNNMALFGVEPQNTRLQAGGTLRITFN